MHDRAKFLGDERRRERTMLFTLLATVCLVYLPFLGNPFVFDDLSFFKSGLSVHYVETLAQLELRGLPYASLGWTVAIFSDVVPHFFHLGNLLLHATNVVLLFLLLRRLLRVQLLPDAVNVSSVVWGAWLGALVFACHPVAVYAVGYVVERSILLATLFSLLAQWAYLRGLLEGQKRWLILTVAAYFLACFSKEHSVMLLAVLVAQTVLLRGKMVLNRQKLGLVWAAFLVIALFWLWRVSGGLAKPYEAMAPALFAQQGLAQSNAVLHGLSVLTQAGLFFKYLLLWFVPNPAWMSVDMREPFLGDLLSWQSWLGMGAFAAYGMLGGWLLLRPRWQSLLGWALLYPWLQFMVEFSVVRVQEPFVLYRSYLWMPGMMMIFPLLLVHFPGRKTIFGLFGVAVLLVPLAWNRLITFSDNYRLWDDAAALLRNDTVPGADRIFYNRAQALVAKHQWEEAIVDFKRVVAISPQLAPVRYALGMAYVNAGHYSEAIEQFDAELAIKQNEARGYFGKGLALMGLHQKDAALVQMQRGCELGNDMACAMASWSQPKKE